MRVSECNLEAADYEGVNIRLKIGYRPQAMAVAELGLNVQIVNTRDRLRRGSLSNRSS